jgi:hypothetical protein
MFAGSRVFVGSDETIWRTISSFLLAAFRRLLLQIGGANIAPRGSRLAAAYFVVTQ